MCCTDKGENWGKACAYDVYAVGERMACVYNLYIWKELKVKKFEELFCIIFFAEIAKGTMHQRIIGVWFLFVSLI